MFSLKLTLLLTLSYFFIFSDLNFHGFSVNALNVGVQSSGVALKLGKECSRKCESEFCSVPPFLRYGKYCGLLYSGCPGERPCDGLDACCMKHDMCVSAKNNNYLSQECSKKFISCMESFRSAGAHSFKGSTCDANDVIDVLKVVMEAALLAGAFNTCLVASLSLLLYTTMAARPELLAPPEIFYDQSEARKYTSSSRIIDIQAKLSERALELLALPDDGEPRLLLDIGCGSGLSGETLSENGHHWIGLDISDAMLDVALEREVEGDLLLADMGQGLGLRPGVIDGAISISAVQWLCNADKSSHEPRLRLKAFFVSLYRSLARGARAVLQVYPQNTAQRELILGFAMRAGFAGGVVVDFPHSTKSRKEYLVLTCGPPSLSSATPKAKGEDGVSCSDDESSGDEENKTVSVSDRHRPRKRQKLGKKIKGREWVLQKKDQMRRKGATVPADTKYTARKRKSRF